MKAVGLVLGMFLAGLAAASVISISSGNSFQKKDGPTKVQVGTMTEQQRVHSKLFERYSAGRKLDVALRESSETEEETVYLEPGITVTTSNAPVQSFLDFLKDLSCDADAIVFASAKGRASQLTENREFVFTDYIVTPEEVLKNNVSFEIVPNTDITVTRPGGRVQIKGRIVNAIDASFKPLDIGKRYLLFLKYLPETGAYKSIRRGSFLTQDNNLVALTEEGIPGGPGDTRSLTPEFHRVLTSGCDKDK